jgi:hypothetical protein
LALSLWCNAVSERICLQEAGVSSLAEVQSALNVTNFEKKNNDNDDNDNDNDNDNKHAHAGHLNRFTHLRAIFWCSMAAAFAILYWHDVIALLYFTSLYFTSLCFSFLFFSLQLCFTLLYFASLYFASLYFALLCILSQVDKSDLDFIKDSLDDHAKQVMKENLLKTVLDKDNLGSLGPLKMMLEDVLEKMMHNNALTLEVRVPD